MKKTMGRKSRVRVPLSICKYLGFYCKSIIEKAVLLDYTQFYGVKVRWFPKKPTAAELDMIFIHCKKSFLKIREYIPEGANLKIYIPDFFNFNFWFLNIHLFRAFGSKLPDTFFTV
jgi:hypothetical protein